MKNKTSLFLFLILSLITIPSIVLGINLLAPITAPGNPLECENIYCVIDRLINFTLILAFGIAPIMIIISGYCFITSMASPEKIANAKKLILYTIIGLIIIVCAKSLVLLFQESLGVK